MIISASRRTDIPALYMEWFVNRLQAGEALVRNPMRYSQIRTVPLTPEHVDGIVFWSKFPEPMLQCLKQLQPYPFYILYTLNPYKQDIEPDLPDEKKRIDVFLRLADALGPDRLVWRYDPIVISETYPDSFHRENFARLAALLAGSTRSCKISFVQSYAKNRKALALAHALHPAPEQKISLAQHMQALAERAGITLGACCDSDLIEAGLASAACVDARLIAKISGKKKAVRRDGGQRDGCSCSQSVDIGVYDTCTHGCVYCYANRSIIRAACNRDAHIPSSPFLSGE